MKLRSIVAGFLVLAFVGTSHAQLSNVFSKIFNQVLRNDVQLSPGLPSTHFFEAADHANAVLTPALNTLIASNVSSFPLSSTAAGVTFDFSSGQPISTTESLGPIFAERPQTLGGGKLNLGFNYTNLNLARLRGIRTQDMRFTFTHVDVTPDDSLGNNPNESDTIDLFPNLDVDANIYAVFATVGVTDHFDVGVAVPFVSVAMHGKARAVINSFTFAFSGSATHRFNSDPLNPDFVDEIPYDVTSTGVGDIALRLKYNFGTSGSLDWAALADIRLPTGDEKNYRGTGKAEVRLAWAMSTKIHDFNPHLNFGYDRRGGKADSDELEFTIGFDQKVATGVTFAADFLGEVDLNSDERIRLFPGSVTIVDRYSTGTGEARNVRKVDLSNIPDRKNDNTLNAAFGFRLAPSERLLLLANMLVPLNSGGLRSTVVPTVGATVSF